MNYLGRRLVHALLLLAVVAGLSFLLLQAAPGEFFSDMRVSPSTSPETINGWRQQYGLDIPLPQRYLRWMKSALHGDFGASLSYHLPVSELLRERAANTLLLTVTATVITWVFALPLGVWAAAHRNRFVQHSFAVGTSTLLSIPELVIAFALVALAARTGVLPLGGMQSVGAEQLSLSGKLIDRGRHLLLPVLTIVLAALPVIARHARATVLELLEAPFVQAARSHGLYPRTILFRYVLRTAANPLISLLGFSIATLISGSLLVEIVMGWPGMGPLLLEAILARDINVVLGAVIISTVFLVGGNLISDVLLYAADPRIREGQP
jgi:peptide/nickel transport system permease protein